MFNTQDHRALSLAERRPRVVKSILAFVTLLPVLFVAGALVDLYNAVGFAEQVGASFSQILSVRSNPGFLHMGPELDAVMRIERALGRGLAAVAFTILAAVVWFYHLRARRLVRALREAGVWRD